MIQDPTYYNGTVYTVTFENPILKKWEMQYNAIVSMYDQEQADMWLSDLTEKLGLKLKSEEDKNQETVLDLDFSEIPVRKFNFEEE